MLSPEQRERLNAMLGASEDDGNDEPETTSTQESSSPAQAAPEVQPEPEARPEAPAVPPQGKSTPPPVPYQRFSEVNSARKAAEARAKELEDRLAAMQNGQGSVLDYLQTPSEQTFNLPPEVQARLEALELQEGERRLESELARVERDHPEVDQQWLIRAVASGAEIEDAVAFWSTVYSAAAEKVKAQQTQRTAPQVPPAVRNTASTVNKPVVRPQNLAEAHAAFRKLLRNS